MGVELRPFPGKLCTKYLIVLLVLSAGAFAKDAVQVEVKATHATTRDDRGFRAITEKGMMGAHSAGKQVEVFNLDTIINGEHVLLSCDDDKGCETPAVGIYTGELWRKGHVKLAFDLPVTHKKVSRWYKISGSW